MLPDPSDKDGHSLRMLLQFAIKQFPPAAVAEFLYDKDPLVRVKAASRFATDPLLQEQANDLARKLTTERRASLRELGAYLLGQIGGPEHPYRDSSIPILEGLLTDPSPAVRGASIVALGHLQSKSSKALLLRSLKSGDAMIVDAVSYALWSIGRTEKDLRCLQAAIKQFDRKTQKSIDLWED